MGLSASEPPVMPPPAPWLSHLASHTWWQEESKDKDSGKGNGKGVTDFSLPSPLGLVYSSKFLRVFLSLSLSVVCVRLSLSQCACVCVCMCVFSCVHTDPELLTPNRDEEVFRGVPLNGTN